MFIVVETVKNGEKCVTVAPQCWVTNQILNWPCRGNVARLSQQEKTPGTNWQKIRNFKILEKEIPTYAEARKRNLFFERTNDLNSQREDLTVGSLKRKHPTQNLDFFENTITEDMDVNDDFIPETNLFSEGSIKFEFDAQDEEFTDVQKSERQYEDNADGDDDGDTSSQLINLENVSDLDLVKKEPQLHRNGVNDQQIASNNVLDALRNEIMENRRLIIEISNRQEAAITNVAEMVRDIAVKMDRIRNSNNVIPIDESFIMPSIPVTTAALLKKLNKKLRKKEFFDQMAIRLKQSVNASKAINKCVRQLCEKIITYDVLILHSWSGKTCFNGAQEKLIFLDYSNIIRLICSTINLVMETDDKLVQLAIREYVKRGTQNYKRMIAKT